MMTTTTMQQNLITGNVYVTLGIVWEALMMARAELAKAQDAIIAAQDLDADSVVRSAALDRAERKQRRALRQIEALGAQYNALTPIVGAGQLINPATDWATQKVYVAPIAEEIAEDAAEDVAPIAEYADVIATRLANAFSRTSAGAARTRGVLDTLLGDAEPAPMTPDEIGDALHTQEDRANAASAEVYELCDGGDEHAEHIDAAYEAALGAEDCRIEAIDLIRELYALQHSSDSDRNRQIGLIQYELEQLLRIATEHADRAEDILSTVHATR